MTANKTPVATQHQKCRRLSASHSVASRLSSSRSEAPTAPVRQQASSKHGTIAIAHVGMNGCQRQDVKPTSLYAALESPRPCLQRACDVLPMARNVFSPTRPTGGRRCVQQVRDTSCRHCAISADRERVRTEPWASPNALAPGAGSRPNDAFSGQRRGPARSASAPPARPR